MGKGSVNKHKKQLFDDNEDADNDKGEDKLKINEQFAKRFEHNKRRQLLEKAEEKYGSKFLEKLEKEDQVSSSSSSDEDSDAELVNPKFEKKFIETITMIRENAPQLKDLKDELFKDSDFEEDIDQDENRKNKQINKKDKPLTYKDQIRKDILKREDNSSQEEGEASDSDEDEEEIQFNKKRNQLFEPKNKEKETIAQEERRLKDEFKQAALQESDQEMSEHTDENDDGFIMKKQDDSEDEADNGQNEEEDLENLKLEQVLKKAKKRDAQLVTDVDLLKRFWGNDNRLDEADKFLRNYILLEGWKDKGNMKNGINNDLKKADQEDENRDEEVEKFEHSYNMRFEDAQAAQYLTTHSRQVEDTMRRKDDKRKAQRDAKKERKELEKRQKHEELNRLKQMKKDEIMEKLRKAEFLSGLDHKALVEKKILDKVEKELKTEYIPELYDKTMDKLFDDKYYEMSDEEAEQVEQQKQLNVRLMKDKEPVLDDEDNEEDAKSEDSEGEYKTEKYERELAKSLKNQAKQKDEQDLQGQQFDTWYACDGCTKPIDAGQFHFDCNQCENFTFCERCFKKNKTHLHKFTKNKVPVNNAPPENHSELIAKAYMLCNSCGDCLLDLSKRVYICRPCSTNMLAGDIIYFCLKCKEKGVHSEHKLEKLKGLPGDPAFLKNKDKENMTEEEKNQYLEGLLEEYYNLDYEDVIGGGTVKTRFKYKKVAEDAFGLTEDEIFLLDDNQLNRLVSLKKYRPYEDGQEDSAKNGVNVHRIHNIMKTYRNELNEKKKMLNQALVQEVELDKQKHFKGNKSEEVQRKRDNIDRQSKNQLRKEKRLNKDRDTKNKADDNDENEGQDEEDFHDEAAKKRRRLALYGKK